MHGGTILNHTVHQDFSRDLGPSDWQLFCKHAHRVRKFVDHLHIVSYRSTHLHSRTYEYAPNAMNILVNLICQHGCLFPGLETLHVDSAITSQHWLQLPNYLPYLSRATLQHLRVKLQHAPHKRYINIYVDLPEIIPHMRSAWPYLRSLKLSDLSFPSESQWQRFESHTNEWASLLGSLSRVQTLRICLATLPSLLGPLSNLPLLHTMKINRSHLRFHKPRDWPSPESESFRLSPSCFPSLVDLDMDVNILKSALDPPMLVLHSLGHSQTLTHLNISLEIIQSSAGVSTTFEAISRISPLKHLQIIFHHPDSQVADHTSVILSGNLFSTLYSLHHLQHIEITSYSNDYQVTIGDQDLHDAAIAWPDLQVIELGGLSATRVLPRISLVGVQALYNNCPELTTVYLKVNCDLPVKESLSSGRRYLDLPAPQTRREILWQLGLTFVLRSMDDYWDSTLLVATAVRGMFPQVRYFHPSVQGESLTNRWGREVDRLYRGRLV